MCKDTDANIDAYAKVFACMYACMCESHITLQSQKKGFCTQPLRLQGLVDKARKRNEAKSAFDSRWQAQSYKYFKLETNTVIRALSLSPVGTEPALPSTRHQEPANTNQLIGEWAATLRGGERGTTPRLELRGGSKNQCFHLWPIKTSLFLPIKGCTIFWFFYYQNTPTPGNTETPLKARQLIYLRKSDQRLQRQQDIESKEMRSITWSLQCCKS